jgi:hypothetical protein
MADYNVTITGGGGGTPSPLPFGQIHPLSLEVNTPWSIPAAGGGTTFPPVLFDAFDTISALPLSKDINPLGLPFAIFDKASATITIQRAGQYRMDLSLACTIEDEQATPSTTKFSLWAVHSGLAAPTDVVLKVTAGASGQDIDRVWHGHRIFNVDNASLPYTIQLGYTIIDPPPTEGIFISSNLGFASKTQLTISSVYYDEPQPKIPA